MNPFIPWGRLAVVTVTCGCLLLSGCTTLQSVALPAQGTQPLPVRVGDKVEVQTITGQTLAFVITQIEPDALIGSDVRVNIVDITGLKVRRVAKIRTGAMVVTVGLLAGLAILLSQGIAFMPTGPSSW